MFKYANYLYLVSKSILQKTRKDPIMTYEEFKEKVGSVILTDDGNCPVTPVVQMLQGKWKLQILYELCIKCPMRFGELKKSVGNVSQEVLTAQLRQMEDSGLLTRTVYPEVPPRVEYTLTELGYSLKPILDAMWNWGEEYQAKKL